VLKREILNLIPIDKNDNYIINYQIPQKTFSIFKSRDVASDSLPDNFFKDKIVFIGGGGSQFHDSFRTPLYGTILPSNPDTTYRYMSGVEIHANALNTLLTKDFISFFPMGWNIVILIIVILGVSVLIFKCGRDNKKAISFVFSGIGIFCIISIIGFLFDQWINIAIEVLLIPLSWFLVKLFDHWYQQKKQALNEGSQVI
jgi:CHASE2 domain-containing sensor protein